MCDWLGVRRLGTGGVASPPAADLGMAEMAGCPCVISNSASHSASAVVTGVRTAFGAE